MATSMYLTLAIRSVLMTKVVDQFIGKYCCQYRETLWNLLSSGVESQEERSDVLLGSSYHYKVDTSNI